MPTYYEILGVKPDTGEEDKGCLRRAAEAMLCQTARPENARRERRKNRTDQPRAGQSDQRATAQKVRYGRGRGRNQEERAAGSLEALHRAVFRPAAFLRDFLPGIPVFRRLCVLRGLGVGAGSRGYRDHSVRSAGDGRRNPASAARSGNGCSRSGLPPPAGKNRSALSWLNVIYWRRRSASRWTYRRFPLLRWRCNTARQPRRKSA